MEKFCYFRIYDLEKAEKYCLLMGLEMPKHLKDDYYLSDFQTWELLYRNSASTLGCYAFTLNENI